MSFGQKGSNIYVSALKNKTLANQNQGMRTRDATTLKHSKDLKNGQRTLHNTLDCPKLNG